MDELQFYMVRRSTFVIDLKLVTVFIILLYLSSVCILII